MFQNPGLFKKIIKIGSVSFGGTQGASELPFTSTAAKFVMAQPATAPVQAIKAILKDK